MTRASHSYSENQRVIYSFAPRSRAVGAKQQIVCEVVDPRPFRDSEYDREDRLRVRCVDERDPMNGQVFIPFASRLTVKDYAEAVAHRITSRVEERKAAGK